MLHRKAPVTSAGANRLLFAKYVLMILEATTLFGVARLGDVISVCVEDNPATTAAPKSQVVVAAPPVVGKRVACATNEAGSGGRPDV